MKSLRQNFPYPLRLAQTGQTSRRQDDGVVLAFLQLAHASVNIAAQRMNNQVGPHSLQLRLPPQAAGAHTRRLRQGFDAVVLHRQEHIARIDARGNRDQLERRRQFGRQIFQAVHRKIDAPFGERFFNLFGEHALGADLGQRDVGNLVAGGLDDLDLDLMAAFAKQRRDMVGLPESELGSARTDSEARHQFCAPGFPLPALLLSGRSLTCVT